MSDENLQVRKLAVLAYGSLLAHPGDWLGKVMVNLIRCETPFGVEYAGQALERRAGAPTLVKWDAGIPVRAGLIVLPLIDRPDYLKEVRAQVAVREGAKDGTSTRIKDDLEMLGYRVVYSDFDVKTAENELTPQHLATLAIESVAKCLKAGSPFMNGIRYLLENMEWGVATRLTPLYAKAILEITESKSLDLAEARLLAEASDDKSHKRDCF